MRDLLAVAGLLQTTCDEADVLSLASSEAMY